MELKDTELSLDDYNRLLAERDYLRAKLDDVKELIANLISLTNVK